MPGLAPVPDNLPQLRPDKSRVVPGIVAGAAIHSPGGLGHTAASDMGLGAAVVALTVHPGATAVPASGRVWQMMQVSVRSASGRQSGIGQGLLGADPMFHRPVIKY